MLTTFRRAIGGALLFCLSVMPAHAQYFGQNKVQFADLQFRVLRTEHFDIYHYPETDQAVRHAARMAERWYARLSQLLDFEFANRQPLVLYANHPHFRQTNTIPGFLGESTGGVTEALKRRVVMPFAAGLGETDHVLGHELVHAFQYALWQQGARRMLTLPLWFIEGMAEYLSLGPVDAHTAMWIRDASTTEDLPTIPQLSRQRYFPYRWGHALWAYLGGRFGDDAIGTILKAAGASGDLVGAIEDGTGVDIETLSSEWHQAIMTWAAPTLTDRAAASDATALITRTGRGGNLNVGPALSPDGRQVVFLSERDLLSIDMFLADAQTGRILRKLVETAADPHFDSLQFVASSGAWSPDGQRFIFSAVRSGRPVLTIVNPNRGTREREIRLAELGEVYTPTWSPDGQRVAFSALRDGLADLYVYDLETDTLRQLTSDAFADLHPSWAPDGSRIAFTTDRFTSDLSTLRFGEYRLGLIDADTGAIEPLPVFDAGKQINPQWSSDGQSFYFVADPDGVSNVFRMSLDTAQITQVTNVGTGISGISRVSPALSVAREVDQVAFSVYRDGRYEIHAITPTMGAPMDDTVLDRRAATLPPEPRPDGTVAVLLADLNLGLPPEDDFPIDDVAFDLDLDYVGQPYVLAGTDRFGTFFGGGVSFLFSDMLGDHTLGVALQVGGTNQSLSNIATQVGYINRTSRWNWGITLEQLPFVTGAFREGLDTRDGQLVVVQEELEFKHTSRQLMGVTAYPFDRANRLEFSGGARRLSFKRSLRTRQFSLLTSRLVEDQKTSLPTPGAVGLAEFGAAFVHDTSVMGATGPILGQRYRLDVAPTVGDLTFTTLQADYRQYLMPVRPYTIAGRVLYMGRYGTDAGDRRLTPVFLGYPSLVRGYDFETFSPDECLPTQDSACPVFDQLIGTRMVVVNLELRFPLLGAFTGELDYGILPIDAVVFADGGVTWALDQEPAVLGGDRRFVTSVGAGLRINLFGSAVIELDAVHPLDRPQKDWLFTFGFRPGF